MKECNNRNVKEQYEISITTINWNVSRQLENCINSVLKYSNDVNYEWYIIDNNSKDDYFDILSEKYSKYKNLKFNKNKRNEGALVRDRIINKINSRYILFLQPDVTLENNAIRKLIDYMNSDEDNWAASANLLNPDGSLQLYYSKLPNISSLFFVRTEIGKKIDQFIFSNRKRIKCSYSKLSSNEKTQVEQCGLVCFIMNKDFLLEYGYFHEYDFAFFYGDVDICKKIKDKNHKIYVIHSAKVIHHVSSSLNKANDNWYFTQFLRAQIKYFRRYHKNKLYLVKLLVVFDCIYSFFKLNIRKWKEIIQSMANVLRY